MANIIFGVGGVLSRVGRVTENQNFFKAGPITWQEYANKLQSYKVSPALF